MKLLRKIFRDAGERCDGNDFFRWLLETGFLSALGRYDSTAHLGLNLQFQKEKTFSRTKNIQTKMKG
jgi:hypothetical protein